MVDGRRKMLQKYICDIGEIQAIRESRKFKQFLGVSEGGLEIEDVALPQTSIEEIFDQFTSKTTTQQKSNAYETFTTRYFIPLNFSHQEHSLHKSSTPYLTSKFTKKLSKSGSVARSQNRIPSKKDKLTLMESFQHSNMFSNALMNNKKLW